VRFDAGLRRKAWLVSVWAAPLTLAAQCALASPPKVAAFGDSLTEGYPFLNDPWIQRLEPDVNGVNLGLSSERSEDGLVRLQAWLDAHPGVADVVIIMEGTNDTDEGSGTTWNEAETVANLQAMVAAVVAYGAVPILMAPPPVISDASATAKLDGLATALETWASDGQSVPFVHLFDEFNNHPDTSSLFHSDGIHLSDAGNAFVAEVVRAALPAQAPALSRRESLIAGLLLTVTGGVLARRRCGVAAAPAS
jgi:lysophospholipase L1-like esterase